MAPRACRARRSHRRSARRADNRNGLLGTAKVRLLLAARRRVEAIFADHEAELVEHLRPLTVAHASVVLARWRHHALATAGTDDNPAPTDPTQNTLHLSRTLGGRYALDGDADVETGALLDAAVTNEVDALFRTGAFTRHDTLAAGQRRMTALANLVNRGAATTVPPAPETGTGTTPPTTGTGTPPGTTGEDVHGPATAGTEPPGPDPTCAEARQADTTGAEPDPASGDTDGAGTATAGPEVADTAPVDPAPPGIEASGSDVGGNDATGTAPVSTDANRTRPSSGDHVANAAWFADPATLNNATTTATATAARSSGRGPACRVGDHRRRHVGPPRRHWARRRFRAAL